MTFSKSFLKKISTSAIIRPNSPDIDFDNPLDEDTIINGIELILTPEFSKKGNLIILVNGISIFDENDSENFRAYLKFPIPLGKTLKRSNKIEVFAWNEVDSNTLECSLNFSISKNQELFQSQAIPLSNDELNTSLNEGEILFSAQLRNNQTDYALINMQGNKKLRVFLSGASYVPPTHIRGGANICDGSLATSADASTGVTSSEHGVVDFGDSISRNVKCEWGFTFAGGGVQHTMYLQGCNVLDVGWTTVDTANFNPQTDGVLQGTATYRYWRLYQDSAIDGAGHTIKNFEIYDTALFGGTSVLSFEALNVATDIFQEVIASSEFGTLSQGSAIVKEVGDVNTISISGKTYALPSSQNQFRAKLVTTGAINNGISIVKMK